MTIGKRIYAFCADDLFVFSALPWGFICVVFVVCFGCYLSFPLQGTGCQVNNGIDDHGPPEVMRALSNFNDAPNIRTCNSLPEHSNNS